MQARCCVAADRELINAEDVRSEAAGAQRLLPHVALAQFLDRMPVMERLLGETSLIQLHRNRLPT